MGAVAEQDTTLGVLSTDADHFKDVNDTFGHNTGDKVLRMVGQSLANGLRRGDVPVRWGGEEFLAHLWKLIVSTAVDGQQRGLDAGLESGEASRTSVSKARSDHRGASTRQSTFCHGSGAVRQAAADR